MSRALGWSHGQWDGTKAIADRVDLRSIDMDRQVGVRSMQRPGLASCKASKDCSPLFRTGAGKTVTSGARLGLGHVDSGRSKITRGEAL